MDIQYLLNCLSYTISTTLKRMSDCKGFLCGFLSSKQEQIFQFTSS